MGTCRTVYPDLWYPEASVSDGNIAKSICRKCPVIDVCLDYALKNNETYGIWGGKTPFERRKLRRTARVRR